MEDRLGTVLRTVINNTDDATLISILESVLELDQEINAFDVNSWDGYVESDTFVDDMLSWFEDLD